MKHKFPLISQVFFWIYQDFHKIAAKTYQTNDHTCITHDICVMKLCEKQIFIHHLWFFENLITFSLITKNTTVNWTKDVLCVIQLCEAEHYREFSLIFMISINFRAVPRTSVRFNQFDNIFSISTNKNMFEIYSEIWHFSLFFYSFFQFSVNFYYVFVNFHYILTSFHQVFFYFHRILQNVMQFL